MWRKASRYDSSLGSPSTWVMTITHRRAVDRVRSAQTAADREMQVARRETDRPFDDVSEQAAVRFEQWQVRQCLSTLMDSLALLNPTRSPASARLSSRSLRHPANCRPTARSSAVARKSLGIFGPAVLRLGGLVCRTRTLVRGGDVQSRLERVFSPLQKVDEAEREHRVLDLARLADVRHWAVLKRTSLR
ncbi:sigma factor [Lentzea kentuckyensis]|uniref:sigma factor n=1 Tax=Lentzea kentuckyensis TaxID=360086 RepID=UPI001FE58094|nr:sigma factor [Lentzea kentuckyensis]